MHHHSNRVWEKVDGLLLFHPVRSPFPTQLKVLIGFRYVTLKLKKKRKEKLQFECQFWRTVHHRTIVNVKAWAREYLLCVYKCEHFFTEHVYTHTQAAVFQVQRVLLQSDNRMSNISPTAEQMDLGSFTVVVGEAMGWIVTGSLNLIHKSWASI